ncbi:MAG: CBS domain-containing protein [Acetobacteraceae bacterium]|nr:CBS domain-containing protein [Acetobacteraceae bacterium]
MTNRPMSEIVRNQKPLAMPPETTVEAACARMHERRVGAVLVVDAAGTLVGIFTGRDAVRCLAHVSNPAHVRLAEVMTRDPDTMPPRATAIEALRLMRDGGFRHVPVVDQGRVVGVVSSGDFRGLEQDRLDEETGIWERI